MNLLEYKQEELKILSKDKDHISYKWLKWFLDNAEYKTSVNIKMSKELGKNSQVKMCYKNSLDNIHNKDIQYIEGYIYSKLCPVPLDHAYLMDGKGYIVDPTMGISNKKEQFKKQGLDDSKYISKMSDNQYLGVSIDKETLIKMVIKRKTYDNNLTSLFLEHRDI